MAAAHFIPNHTWYSYKLLLFLFHLCFSTIKNHPNKCLSTAFTYSETLCSILLCPFSSLFRPLSLLFVLIFNVHLHCQPPEYLFFNSNSPDELHRPVAEAEKESILERAASVIVGLELFCSTSTRIRTKLVADPVEAQLSTLTAFSNDTLKSSPWPGFRSFASLPFPFPALWMTWMLGIPLHLSPNKEVLSRSGNLNGWVASPRKSIDSTITSVHASTGSPPASHIQQLRDPDVLFKVDAGTPELLAL